MWAPVRTGFCAASTAARPPSPPSPVPQAADTLPDVYEPYLLQLGFIARTPRGRICLKGGYEHLGITPPDNAEEGKKKQLSLGVLPDGD